MMKAAPPKAVTRELQEIRASIKAEFDSENGSHDWGHIERVLALCETIRRREGGDRRVIELAALLHDVGRLARVKQAVRLGGHARRGAVEARRVLASMRVEAGTIDAVVHCIEAHSYRHGVVPLTVEARVLFDADKLDSIGAMGVGRAFLFAGEIGAKAHNEAGVNVLETSAMGREDTAYREYMFKLRHIKDRMHTKEGRRLARARHNFMKKFFDELVLEAAGRA
ncbi:MAG: HD domain-containing protein [Myxococcota bacterium]|jgi:uncharacterized protein